MSLGEILIPHDGSQLSGTVVATLGALLTSHTQVTLVHVDDGSGADTGAVDATEAELKGKGAVVQRRDVASKDPAGTIVDVAGEVGAGLIAMTTHGRSGVERWIRGSVASRVLQASPVPVFSINPFTHKSVSMESVLVPLDASASSAEILDTLLPLASAFGSRLTLLYVDWDDPTDGAEQRHQRRETRQQDVSEWLAAPLARAAAAGVSTELRIEHGDVAEQILDVAEKGDFGLLAMSTHGHSGPARWLMGSIAEKVLRECRSPTLLRRITKAD
jgi:nucleotide-binding universal stress UspA family protein